MLNLFQLQAAAQPVDGKAMAQRMGCHVRIESRLPRVAFDDQPQPLPCQLLTAMIQKEGVFIDIADELRAPLAR